MQLLISTLVIAVSCLPVGAARAGAPEPPAASATFGPPLAAAGYVVGSSAELRHAPNGRGPVIARVRASGPGDSLEVLELTGRFARVRVGAVEGWASTLEALPRTVAYLVDARTGATRARRPVNIGSEGVVFSPDGSRLVTCGYAATGNAVATEYRTGDLRPLRSVTATGTEGRRIDVVAAFYGGPEGALYAAVLDGFAADGPRLSVVRVHAPEEPAPAPALEGPGSGLTVSPDGRVGFVVRSASYDMDVRATAATIDVVDLRTIAVRNTLVLDGALAAAFGGVEPSADGSELLLLGDVSRVRVLDTATGRETRQIVTGWSPDAALSLVNLCAGGRARLIEAAGNPCEVAVPEGARWMADASVAPGPSVACAVDAGTRRFGLDAEARLLVLGPGERATTRARLRLPHLPSGQWVSSMEMTASPDGATLVVIVSFAETFCPC